MSKKGLKTGSDLRSVPTGWTDSFAICRKCSKKLDGGFGEEEHLPLRKALREGLRAAGRRGEIGLFDAACFGVCPKQAITVALASRPGALLVVPTGSSVETLILLAKQKEAVLF